MTMFNRIELVKHQRRPETLEMRSPGNIGGICHIAANGIDDIHALDFFLCRIGKLQDDLGIERETGIIDDDIFGLGATERERRTKYRYLLC